MVFFYSTLNFTSLLILFLFLKEVEVSFQNQLAIGKIAQLYKSILDFLTFQCGTSSICSCTCELSKLICEHVLGHSQRGKANCRNKIFSSSFKFTWLPKISSRNLTSMDAYKGKNLTLHMRIFGPQITERLIGGFENHRIFHW